VVKNETTEKPGERRYGHPLRRNHEAEKRLCGKGVTCWAKSHWPLNKESHVINLMFLEVDLKVKEGFEMNNILKIIIFSFLAAILFFGCEGVPEEKSAAQATSAESVFDSSAEMVSGKSDSKTIFMIHGMWGGPWVWKNYKTFFETKGYHCVTPTLRFHDMNPDDSPDPQLGTVSLLDYASDLEKEIKQLDEKPIIMGHSMGGLLAQILGSRGLAKSLVLITPVAPSGINCLKFSVIKTFWGMTTTWGWWKKPNRISYDSAVYGIIQLVPPEQQKEIYSKLVYESGRAAFEIGWWLFDSTDASKVNESDVTCPVLVIAGKEDRLVPPSVVKKVAKKYESVSTYLEFDNHAHFVLSEPNWEVIAESVDSWLKKN
jgi:non-heme chloroperoxidase